MKMSIEEKKSLYAFGCPNHRATVERLRLLAAITPDPKTKKHFYTLAIKLLAVVVKLFVTFLANKIKLLCASILAVSATLDNGTERYYQIVADSDNLKNRFCVSCTPGFKWHFVSIIRVGRI